MPVENMCTDDTAAQQVGHSTAIAAASNNSIRGGALHLMDCLEKFAKNKFQLGYAAVSTSIPHKIITSTGMTPVTHVYTRPAIS